MTDTTLRESGRLLTNGIHMCYEVHGRTDQRHGRTSDRDDPSTFETSADDVASLVRQRGFEQVDIFGFSNGASIALQVAIRHPLLVRKLVFASGMTRKDGAKPELWEFMARADFSNMPQPLKDAERMRQDCLGEAVMTQRDTRYPELTAGLIEEFLGYA